MGLKGIETGAKGDEREHKGFRDRSDQKGRKKNKENRNRRDEVKKDRRIE